MLLHFKHNLPPLALLAVLVGAIIHDFQHPGVNNNFLLNTLDPLALDYNGISVE